MLYHGGLTFDLKTPGGHLKIPNRITARRIAVAILKHYNITATNLKDAINHLKNTGDISLVLQLYQHLMCKQDVEVSDFDKAEEQHAMGLNFVLVSGGLLTIELKYNVKVRNKNP